LRHHKLQTFSASENVIVIRILIITKKLLIYFENKLTNLPAGAVIDFPIADQFFEAERFLVGGESGSGRTSSNLNRVLVDDGAVVDAEMADHLTLAGER
jgi:hypothetical protein